MACLINVWYKGTSCFALIKSAPSSAPAANNIALMICAVFCTAPLFGRNVILSDKEKKCPPILLHAFGSLKYDASLYTASTISLA